MSSTLNPFKPGDRVVCIDEKIEGPAIVPSPKKGEILKVDEVDGTWLRFYKYDLGWASFFNYWHFAPVQDATDMEFEDTDTETTNVAAVEHLEEMTV